MAAKHAYPSVHRGIVRGALTLLGMQKEEAADFFTAELCEKLVGCAALPDCKGDFENGTGMHYYCGVKPNGTSCVPHAFSGYFQNGRNHILPSPCTMLEQDYQMAVGQYLAGQTLAAMESLSRAAHMVADVCCPPHACGLTYLSPYKANHQRYEHLAAERFWGTSETTVEAASSPWAQRAAADVPLYEMYLNALLPARLEEKAKAFLEQMDWEHMENNPSPEAEDKSGFLSILNPLACAGREELPDVLHGDDAAICASIDRRLPLAIRHVAALFYLFYCEISAPDTAIAPREDTPCYICENEHAVLEHLFRVRYFGDGTCGFFTEDGRQLAISLFGRAVLATGDAGTAGRFRIARKDGYHLIYTARSRFRKLLCCNSFGNPVQRKEALLFSPQAMLQFYRAHWDFWDEEQWKSLQEAMEDD